VNDYLVLFILGVITGGSFATAGVVMLLTWSGKDDWIEGYKSGIAEGVAIVKRWSK
jgi:hypothetical protein